MRIKQVDGGRCPVCGGASTLYYDADRVCEGVPLDFPVEEFCPCCCDSFPTNYNGDEYTFDED